MRVNMSALDIYTGIVSDFEGAWNALTSYEHAPGRGNFLFMRQAMLLLEFVCRLTSTGKRRTRRHVELSEALYRIQPLYFARMPGLVGDNDRDFKMLSHTADSRTELLHGIFDLCRNGGAHQYQQIPVALPGARSFMVSIGGGPEYGSPPLGFLRHQPLHMAFQRAPRRLWLALCPDTIFLDIKEAAEAVGLHTDRSLRFTHLRRPRKKTSDTWHFRQRELVDALTVAGLKRLPHSAEIPQGWVNSPESKAAFRRRGLRM